MKAAPQSESAGARDSVETSVLIFSSNEAENLSLLLPRLKKVLEATALPHEILLVDAGSRDQTSTIAKDLGCAVYTQRRPGYGNALREGLEKAHGRYVLTLDADLSHDVSYIPEMLRSRDDAPVIVASRYTAGGGSEAALARSLLSRLLNWWYRSTLGVPVRDLSSGFRLYRRAPLQEIRLEGLDFDVLEEILVKMHLTGHRAKEIGFRYRPRQKGRSKARVFRLAIHYLLSWWKLWRLTTLVNRRSCE